MEGVEDRLREKYAGRSAEALAREYGPAAAAAAASAAANGGPAWDGRGGTKVKLCERCEGSGVEQYTYEHRAMERSCTGCDGEGTLTLLNGEVVKPPAPPPPPVHGAEKPRPADLAVHTKLEKALKRLREQKASYKAEIEQLRGKATAGMAEAELTLVKGLIDQLRLMEDKVSEKIETLETKVVARTLQGGQI